MGQYDQLAVYRPQFAAVARGHRQIELRVLGLVPREDREPRLSQQLGHSGKERR
jgi:hypothetical protein